MSSEHFRVLTAIEMGMKNHDLVPLPLIASISALKHGGTHKIVADLLRDKLVSHERQQYDGYRLTYLGYDYLALRSMVKRGNIAAVGQKMGVGKESDIYIVSNDKGELLILKLHRLGRVSFRSIKTNRDYLQNRQSASWMYMSRLAAFKEYAFLKSLYENGFPTPVPIDHNRHCILMSLCDGICLNQVSEISKPEIVRDEMLNLVVKLASHGLIHCDFNEFNLIINDDLKITLIDFPQMISTDHKNAEYYFDRDVGCVERFFRKRFGLLSPELPKLKDIVKERELDIEVEASGFSKVEREQLENMIEYEHEHIDEIEIKDDDDDDNEEENEKREEEEEEEESGNNKTEGGDDDVVKKIVKIELKEDVEKDEDELKELEQNMKKIEIEGEENIIKNTEEEEDDEEKEEERKEKENKSNNGKKICFHCGKEGHIERKCPELVQPKEKKQKEKKEKKEMNDADIKRKIRNEMVNRYNKNKSTSRNILKKKEERKIRAEIKERGEGFI